MDLYQVGAITQTHGVRGEVKVFPLTDDVMRFKNMKDLILDTGREQITLEVNDVEKYKGAKLYVTKENRVACDEDEYFIADLIGLTVVTEEGQALGTLIDVISTGANDVYVVEMPSGREVLLPAIRDCILNVDDEEGKMTVHLLDGLLEEE